LTRAVLALTRQFFEFQHAQKRTALQGNMQLINNGAPR